jgi:hypothetical protein
MSGKAKSFFEQLEGYYYLFVDCFIWKEQAVTVIRDTLQSMAELKVNYFWICDSNVCVY